MVQNAMMTRRQTKIDVALREMKNANPPAVQVETPGRGLNTKGAPKNEAVKIKIEKIESVETNERKASLEIDPFDCSEGNLIGREERMKMKRPKEYKKDYEIEWRHGVGRMKKPPGPVMRTRNDDNGDNTTGLEQKRPELRNCSTGNSKSATNKRRQIAQEKLRS